MNYPPFCPNNDCENHLNPGQNWYVRNGTYHSIRSGSIQRFKCKQCHYGFSTNTFSLDYGVKIKVPYKVILEHLVTASGIRDIARRLNVSCSTVTNRIARLARQAISIQSEISAKIELHEDLVADGFESFTYSQYFPNNIQILVGKDSQYWFLADYAHIGRKGRMTEKQKIKNEKIISNPKLDKISVYESFETLFQEANVLFSRSRMKELSLYTDEHQQYEKVIRNQYLEKDAIKINHIQISSKMHRGISNPLFSVNYIDREIRKDCSDHVRETLQSAKNVANAMDRLVIYRLYHNLMKSFRINGIENKDVFHAMRAGIKRSDIRKEMKTLYTQRRFLRRMKHPNLSDLKLWCRCISTPLKPHGDYLPRYALA